MESKIRKLGKQHVKWTKWGKIYRSCGHRGINFKFCGNWGIFSASLA